MVAKAAKGQAPKESMGFPLIEGLLEEEKPDFSGFKTRFDALLEMSKKSKSAKEKAAARQAALAYQRFLELFDSLLKIKIKVQEKEVKKQPARR